MNPHADRDRSEEPTDRCGFTVWVDGEEQPCDRPATGWRWYQGHEHEDALDVACEWHENEGGRRMAEKDATIARVEALRDDMLRHWTRWTGAEAIDYVRLDDLRTALRSDS